MGHIPILRRKTKLQSRASAARYMFGIDTSHVVVRVIPSGEYKRIRAVDFTLYYHRTDPVHTQTNAFKCHIPYPDPTHITATTPPLRSRKQAQRYPDATQWGAAHDLELNKLDDAGAIKWHSPAQTPTNAKMIPLAMTYRYKRDPNSAVNEDKARCSVRGDLMKPHVHFNPAHKAPHMADKSTFRLLLALKAAGNLKCEHFDITSAYIHEKYQHSKPVYVKQHLQFNGNSSTGGLAGCSSRIYTAHRQECITTSKERNSIYANTNTSKVNKTAAFSSKYTALHPLFSSP